MSDGTLIFDTRIDKKGFELGLSSIKKATDTAFGAFIKLGSLATGALTTMGVIGLNYNKQMETYTTNFEVMLGDVEKAAQKVEELKKFSQKTPFELGDLSNATQTLLAFNVEADNSTETLRMLGDISLGNAGKLETLTRAYGKMYSSQKVTLESINMMIDSGYNPLLQVQEDLGVSMEEVYSMISKGQISFEQLQSAMESATSEGGQFYQGMEKASKTTDGLLSTIKDLVQSKFGEFFSGVSEKIKESLPIIIEWIENLDVNEVISNFEKLIEVIGFVGGSIIALKVATSAYQAVLTTMSIIKTITTALNGMTIAQWLLNAAMSANPVGLVISAIAGLITMFTALFATNDGFRKWMNNIFGWLGKAIGLFADLFDWIGKITGFWDSDPDWKGLSFEERQAAGYGGMYSLDELGAYEDWKSSKQENNYYDINIDSDNVKEFNDIIRMTEDKQVESRMGGY